MNSFVFMESDMHIIRAGILKLQCDLIMEREALLKEGEINGSMQIGALEKRCGELLDQFSR